MLFSMMIFTDFIKILLSPFTKNYVEHLFAEDRQEVEGCSLPLKNQKYVSIGIITAVRHSCPVSSNEKLLFFWLKLNATFLPLFILVLTHFCPFLFPSNSQIPLYPSNYFISCMSLFLPTNFFSLLDSQWSSVRLQSLSFFSLFEISFFLPCLPPFSSLWVVLLLLAFAP